MFDLSVNLWNTISCGIRYSTDLFDPATIERMRRHLEVVLDAVADNPDWRAGELPRSTPEERQCLLVEWNATESPYPRDASVHELFERRSTALRMHLHWCLATRTRR